MGWIEVSPVLLSPRAPNTGISRSPQPLPRLTSTSALSLFSRHPSPATYPLPSPPRRPDVKAALGAAPDRTFESCNMQINQAFMFNGDVAHNTAALIPEMLEAGIRLLIYACARPRSLFHLICR
jgi:hypothetical protein